MERSKGRAKILLSAAALIVLPICLCSCRTATTAAWNPTVLSQRSLGPGRTIGLCDFRLFAGSNTAGLLGVAGAIYDNHKAQEDRPYLERLASEMVGIFEGSIQDKRAFPFTPRAQLAVPPAAGAPLDQVAKQNDLHACLKATSGLVVKAGWNKRVQMGTTWEIVGRDGWKLTIQTVAVSKESQGVFPDPADPELEPVILEMTRENVTKFLAELERQGMTPLSTAASPVSAPATYAVAQPTATSASEPAADPSPAPGPSTCAEVSCSGHGNCIMKRGRPMCACDDGYMPDPATGLSCESYGATSPAAAPPVTPAAASPSTDTAPANSGTTTLLVSGTITNYQELSALFVPESYIQLVPVPPDGRAKFQTDDRGRVYYQSNAPTVPIPTTASFSFTISNVPPGRYFLAAQKLKAPDLQVLINGGTPAGLKPHFVTAKEKALLIIDVPVGGSSTVAIAAGDVIVWTQ